MINLVSKLFGNRNERVLRQLKNTVVKINELEPTLQTLSDAQLESKTHEFKQRLEQGASLESLIPESFAVVREASRRTLGLRHFDVQLIGGIVLHEGKIAEMRTGEGKTLVATLPAYLNALTEKGVHIITVNDYLAKRDAEWMGPIYALLGLTVGVNLSNMGPLEKRSAYAADITYGTNNEYGFDYLRDNMAFAPADKVQRKLKFAIIDEVDSILIDEARTPLIISGPSDDSSDLYIKVNTLIPKLKKQTQEGASGDYTLDEKTKQAHLTEEGHQHIEKLMVDANLLVAGENLYSTKNIPLMHHLHAALRAHTLFQDNVDYIVQNNQVLIVDEHTGRILPGRRWSEGLHQAVEAKENVPIQNENQTLAAITFQNYFRLYEKIAGMTGTADTEAYEFQQIYGLEVVVIPTNQLMRRQDLPDMVYLSSEEKFAAIIQDIRDCVTRKQPVLVGTASIETSEYLSNLLQHEGIAHQVLNAKFHEKEAHIIAEAGRPGAVTIATNMAGRGTDIVLGGKLEAELIKLSPQATEEEKETIKSEWQKRHDAVISVGGFYIIGTERHESRRIDNQLRGRAGRQGDPGKSRFYLSLQDNLMRIFASDRIALLMQKMGMKKGDVIESPLVTRAIETAQRKVEARNFDIRKQLLEFDDVANDQRKVIYEQRAKLMESEDISENMKTIRKDVVDTIISLHIPPETLEEQWNIPALEKQLESDFAVQCPLAHWLETENNLDEEGLRTRVLDQFEKTYEEKEKQAGSLVMRQFEKSIMLQNLDIYWKEHLAAMDHLRQGIHLRGYAQKNPKQEYKKEAFNLFCQMLDNLKVDVIRTLSIIQIQNQQDIERAEEQRRHVFSHNMQFQHPEIKEEAEGKVIPFLKRDQKVGRNEPCPCGSGKKFKHCHGQI
ncbi:MAG: preprotein translocase subunit SecA [Gammaproteobacteria bacterium RIFCSPHIGHO2_02_FULL_38_33]|nr:MAG: preprotein translocase subunit SecA [Gammaproteobacteria bacterium RIFCSPHIGHO2_02_FULL_38_33]